MISPLPAALPHAFPAAALSPEPILAAAEQFRGRWIDGDEPREVAAADFARGRHALARSLAGAGIQPGDRVVLALGNGPHFVAALTAVLARGGSPLLLHWKTPPAELKRTALRYGAPFVLAENLAPAEMPGPVAETSTLEYADWFRATCVRISESEPGFQTNFPALPGVPLHPTSGSTGLPKLAVRPGAAAVAEAEHYIHTTGIHARDGLLIATPMSHAYAFGMGVMVPLLTSATVCSLRQFHVKGVQAALTRGEVTVFPAVPAMLDVLLFGAAKLLAQPRLVLSAGAPLARRTIANFHRTTGGVLRPLYGTTETGGITVGMSGVSPEFGGWVGPHMEGVEVRIAAATHLSGNVGPVEIRSSSMMAGYFDPRGLDTTPLHEGWFRTGDLGWLDDHGGIHLVGRESEVINVSGMKVVPREVEEVLAQFPGVVECKVYAGQQRSGGQFVKAAVVGAAPLDVPLLRAHCEEHLVYYKRPDAFVQIDSLPRNAAGKIIKEKLP